MTAQILDGKAVASAHRKALKTKIAEHVKRGHHCPGLAVILIGDNTASTVYVTNKRNACLEVGIESYFYHLDQNTTHDALTELLNELNHDANIHGILLQLPLPPQLDEFALLEKIDPQKDVDAFHPYNIGCLTARIPALRPCTPYGIIMLLEHYHINLKGKHVVMVGASNIVGRPMALEALLAGATVTITHRFTRDLEHHVRDAEVLVVAVGKIGIVKSEWLRPGCIVVDVGMNRREDGSLCGDIEFESAAERASFITPVPGGVGPMTVTALLENTFQAALHF